MSTAREIAQNAMAEGMPTVSTEDGRFYAASDFTTALSQPDWRIYWVSGKLRGWLLRFAGKDAEVKAKAIAMILNAEDTS